MIKKNFIEYYSFYLTEHLDQKNRILHHLGSILAIYYLLIALLYQHIASFILSIIVLFGFAAVGHSVFENEYSSHFKHVGFGVAADFLMLYHTLTG